MSDIKFRCINCHQSLEAPPDMAGTELDCPSCLRRIVVPTSQKQVAYTAQRRPRFTVPAESAAPDRGSKCHLFGLSTVGIVILSFLLPWVSVSCNSQKLISTTGYTILAETFHRQASSMTSDVSLPVQQGWLCAGLISLLVIGCVILVLSLWATSRRSRTVISLGVGCAILAILVWLTIGYAYGVRAEETIKAEQARSLRNSDGWEALGAAIGASLNFSVDMDAGYYLGLVAFLIAIAAFVVPYHLTAKRTTRNVAVAATVGGITGLGLIGSLCACLITLARPAQFTKPQDFESSFAERMSATKPVPAPMTAPSNQPPDLSQTAPTEKSIVASPEEPREEVFKTELPEVFLNFHLGCTVEEARRIMETGSSPVSFVNAKGSQADEYMLLYRGNQSLPDASATILSFWKGKLYMAAVLFTDDNDKCERLFTVLKHKVTERYGDEKHIIAFGDKAKWNVKGLTVQLEREMGIMEEGKVYLAGIHDWLSSEVEKAKLKKDADRMGEL